MDKVISIMAIPLYVPDGIGPVSDANNNSNILPNNNINNDAQGNQQHSYTVNSVPIAAPVQVQGNLNQNRRNRPINITNFPHQLILELYSFYETHVLGNRNNSGTVIPPPQPQPQTATAMASSQVNQDNQRGSTSRRRSDRVEITVSPLPDIVQCHQGLSLDVTYEASCLFRGGQTTNNSTQTEASSSSSRAHYNSSSTGESSNDMERLAREEWSVEVKLLVGPWKQTGIELRAIADRFTLENAGRNRAEQNASFKLRLLARIAALPAAAILGLGIVWFRNR